LNIVWRGGAAANPTAWDIETTTNWVNAVDNTTPVDYSDFDAVSFSDTANTNRVTLVANLQPASLTMNNNVQTYTFAGSGRLTGGGGQTLQGGGRLDYRQQRSQHTSRTHQHQRRHVAGGRR
jgi:hypothetical protein